MIRREAATTMQATGLSLGGVLPKLARLILPAGAAPVLTFNVPHIDLAGSLALLAYWVAESGGTAGVPLIGLGFTLLLVGRFGLSRKARVVESLVIACALALLLGGGAYLNEHVVKPALAVPRPNIMELATTPPVTPALGMSAEAFYALPDKAARSSHLEKILTPDFRMHERVRSHWIAETGYSFPSGHAFSALMFATFFLAMGLGRCSGRRLWMFYLLVPWAVAVCFSRPLLRVHSTLDVCIGAMEGIIAGLLAYLLVRHILAALLPEPSADTSCNRDWIAQAGDTASKAGLGS
jgi:membrane-associated phospholipid phosphatase